MNKNFAICYNPYVQNSKETKDKLFSKLNNFGIKPKVISIDSLEKGFDLVFVIGGDGTILKASRFYSKTQTPIFGINLGHLGFLSQVSQDELDSGIKKILDNDYLVEQRMMLEFGDYVALNDFVIKGADSSRASKFSLEINSKFVCEYFADGIIISTPTGSTAYNMASGGPVLSPDVDAIVIVPICPHTFSARPIVVSSNDVIKILQPPSGTKYIVSADGQEVFNVQHDIVVKKSDYQASLVMLNDGDFYSVLRNKLHWGLTPAYLKN